MKEVIRVDTHKDISCNPVFVVGAVRSGTTLLQLLLDSHPDIAILGEVHYFDQILQIKQHIPELSHQGALDRFFDLVRQVDNIHYLAEADELFDIVKGQLENEPDPTYEHFYRYLLSEYANTTLKIHIGGEYETKKCSCY